MPIRPETLIQKKCTLIISCGLASKAVAIAGLDVVCKSKGIYSI